MKLYVCVPCGFVGPGADQSKTVRDAEVYFLLSLSSLRLLKYPGLSPYKVLFGEVFSVVPCTRLPDPPVSTFLELVVSSSCQLVALAANDFGSPPATVNGEGI